MIWLAIWIVAYFVWALVAVCGDVTDEPGGGVLILSIVTTGLIWALWFIVRTIMGAL